MPLALSAVRSAARWSALISFAIQLAACGSGASGTDGTGGTPGSSGATGGQAGSGDGTGAQSGTGTGGGSDYHAPPLGEGLGAYPTTPSTPTQGGTMTFGNVGAPGFWPRRIARPNGDPACDYKDGTDTWGGVCCMKEQHTDSTQLAPFDEEMTLIMKAIRLKQLAVYQPGAESTAWNLVSSWDQRSGEADNLVFTQGNDSTSNFDGDLTHDDCVSYFAQEPNFDCGNGSDYYCPDDAPMKRLGWSGSKLIVFLASMNFDDAGVKACDSDATGHPGPWVAIVASELVRDGGRKWNGLCNCYSKTGSVGDGCGEINVFEVVMDNNDFSNREFMSTGLRSFQAGHVGGNVCGVGCDRNDYAANVEVVDACAQKAYTQGPEVEFGGESDGCPVWRRPDGDRYFMILFDETTRHIQVAVLHPDNLPAQAGALLPELPASVERAAIDGLLDLRLPE